MYIYIVRFGTEMPTRLQIARRDILKRFDENPSKILRRREIEQVLAENRAFWRLAQQTGTHQFIEYLTEHGKLRRYEFPFPHRKEIRYAWGEVSLELVLLTLKPDCHFSHHTAVKLHDLTEQDPKTIYVNFEQPPKPVPAAGLEQSRIDAAFRRKPRTTSNVAK